MLGNPLRTLLVLPLFIVALNSTAQNCEANFTFDATGLTIQFTDLSTSTVGDPIVSWDWDFDDGTGSSQQNPLHTFPTPDKYDVILVITTASGCTAEITIRIETCGFNITYTVGNCNANDEVPVTFNITDIYDNAKDIDILLDGLLVVGSPFEIDAANPVNITLNVPGDGLVHTLVINSTDITTCSSTISFTVPDCGSNCFLSSMSVSIAGGTTKVVQVGDNFFSPVNTTIVVGDIVEFQWIGDGHSSTSDANSGPDSWNSGEIGTGAIYPVTITNPGVHPFYCIPHGGPGGTGMSGTIIANCPASGQFTLNINFTTSIADAAGYNVLIDGAIQPGSPHNYSGTGPQSVTASLAGDGQLHVIEIQDVAVPSCFVDRDFIAPDCGAAPACSLSVTAQENGPCSALDEVPVDLVINAINPGPNGFNVLVDGVFDGNYPYNPSGTTEITIQVAGDGANHTIVVTDQDDSQCTATVMLSTTNCTIPCIISNVQAAAGAGATHVVFVEDFVFTPANIVITSGDVVEWQWTGVIDHTSTSDAGSGPDSWNSGLLGQGATYTSPVLSTGVHPYYCIPHGNPGGNGMSGTITVQADCTNGQVSVSVSFSSSGGGFNGYEILVDGNSGGIFVYSGSGTENAVVLVPGDGLSHTITVRDIDDGTCSGTTTIITPDCNASTCQLNVSAQETGPCDASDNVSVEITVTDVGGGASGFQLFIDGSLQGSYPYSGTGTTVINADVAGDGGNHTILIQDIDDGQCSANTGITTTNCTIPCIISNVQATAGAGATHVVFVEDFVFNPANIVITSGDVVEWQWTGVIDHTSTSDAGSGPDSWNSGLLGQGATYTSPVLSTGVHPYYCIPHGNPGGNGMSGTITVQADCTNGQVSVSVSFSSSGGGFNGYEILVDGNSGGIFVYSGSGTENAVVLVPGDGLSHTITVRDIDDGTCSGTTTIITPDCNASTCQLNVSAQETGPCDASDNVSVEITVTDVGGGASGFQLFIDGSLQGSYPYSGTGTTVINADVAGDGGNHIIGVRDIDDPSCLDQIAISTSNCSLPCSISDISLVLIGGNDPVIHTVAVEDFEFVPKDIEVSIGDVVRWEWTGQIAHTTTSDATNGPDSWDSGLLGQGSSFEETIDELGLHPYYCIPHGAPGGIGMAGTINAIASTPCVDGLVSYQVSFNNLNTGQSGFQVFIDGIPDTGNPFSYTGTGSQTIFISLSGDGTVHELTITDADDSSCTANFSFVVPDCDPTYCSLEATATPISPCGDNSLIEYELSLEALNPGSSGFEVFVDGEELPGSPFSYDPGGVTNLQAFLLGDGGTRMIEFQDLDSLGCQFLLEVNTEDCSLPCFLGLETELLEGCNSEGNLTYEITVIGTGTGSQGFDLALDGNLVPGSPFEYSGGVTNIVLEIPGDGQTHQVEVGDLDSLACTGSLSLDVIDCAAGCLLELDNVSINVPQLFEIQVLDYVFEPAVLTVAVGDTIRFIWLGVIPHTTTSDATSGVDTWNSGLLGQGAVYDLIIETPGEHPYYCVPHGAPGGIGMAGLIIAEEPSDDNLLAVQLDFFADNVGPSGFNLFVDGNPAVTNPQSYATSGFNSVFVELPCDGQAYSVQIIDIDDPECTLETSIQMPDCDDPCFGFESGFTYEVDHPNLTIDLTDLSSPETDIWEWQFGDGDFSSNQNPSHVYAIDGLYEVCLISTDIDLACSDTTCTNIQVGGYFCEASFTLESDGMLISFVDNSMVSEPVSNWVWSIDGQPILQGLAQGDYTFDTLGTYELCLSIEGGACVDDTCMTIDLSDPCLLAQANYSYTINQSELSVNFHDLTTGNPHLWLWGFGDGYTSNDQDPAHTYDEPGIYTVCLLVQDTVNQCNRSYCEKIEVGIVGTRPTEIINHDLVLHPNPGPQGFQGWYLEGLSPNDFGKVLQYKIYGVDGRLYMEGDIRGSKQIYLEKTVDFEAGIYFIQLYSDKRLYQGKAIIQ